MQHFGFNFLNSFSTFDDDLWLLKICVSLKLANLQLNCLAFRSICLLNSFNSRHTVQQHTTWKILQFRLFCNIYFIHTSRASNYRVLLL